MAKGLLLKKTFSEFQNETTDTEGILTCLGSKAFQVDHHTMETCIGIRCINNSDFFFFFLEEMCSVSTVLKTTSTIETTKRKKSKSQPL